MNEKELIKRLKLKPHFENGLYVEQNFPREKLKRQKSGAIYYYVRASEKSRFHKIDSDEYWLYHYGSDLEIWIIYPNHKVVVKKCGLGKDANPIVYVPKGAIFASKHVGARRGTLVTCLTVPAFDKASFKIYQTKDLKKRYPALKKF